MIVVIVGPCGVGKSTVSTILANRIKATYLDFDAIGIRDMQNGKGQVSPFSKSGLNLKQSIPMIVESTTTTRIVLDLGGETIFNKKAVNSDRLAQVVWLKETYSSLITVLTADKGTLQVRFVSTKERRKNEFEETWVNWKTIAERYWGKCGDIFIDTSFLTIDETVSQIEANMKRKASQHE